MNFRSLAAMKRLTAHCEPRTIVVQLSLRIISHIFWFREETMTAPLEISRVFRRQISLIRWITYIMSCFEDEKLSSFVFSSLHKKKTTLQCNLSQQSHMCMIKLTTEHEIKHSLQAFHTFIHYNSPIIYTNTHKYTQWHTIIYSMETF